MINWPFVFVWFIIRLCYVGLFFSASLENSWSTIVINGSHHSLNNTEKMEVCSSKKSDLGSYKWHALSLISVFVLIDYLFSRIRLSKLYHPAVFTLLKRREFRAHLKFYHDMHRMTCLSVVTISACQVVRSMGFAVPLTLDYILFSSAAWDCMWGVIYFI